MPLTRRQILIGGFGSGAFVAAAAAYRWVASGYELRPGEVPIALTDKQLVVVRSLVEAILPGGRGVPGGVELGIPQRIDQEVWAAPAHVADDFRAALLLLEHAPPVFGRVARLSALPPAERAAVLQAALAGSTQLLVQAAAAVKQVAVFLYYCRDEIWPHIGYDGPWVKTPAPPESEIAYAALLAARERG